MKKINFTYKDFYYYIKNKGRIICFGAGGSFKEFCLLWQDANINDNIDFIVDNNYKNCEKTLHIYGNDYFVKSFEYLKENFKNQLIIITCRAVKEIQKQITNYNEFSSTIVVDYFNVTEEHLKSKISNTYMPSLKFNKREQIPKKIHYCWFGRNKIPNLYLEYMKSWEKFCPDYEIIEWNEKNYDVTKCKYMSDAYKAKKWGFVSDYARLDIIYEYGGIYLDTDVELLKSLDDMLFQDGFMGFQHDNRVATGLGFGAKPKLSLLLKMLEDYQNQTFIDFSTIKERWEKNIYTCPDYQTKLLEKNGLIRDSFKFQIIDGINIYPVFVFCGKIGNYKMITKDTFAIHHFSGSWMPKS